VVGDCQLGVCRLGGFGGCRLGVGRLGGCRLGVGQGGSDVHREAVASHEAAVLLFVGGIVCHVSSIEI
jgi:hypothetical protein